MNIQIEEKIVTDTKNKVVLKKKWSTPDFEILDTDMIKGGIVSKIHEKTVTSSFGFHGNLS